MHRSKKQLDYEVSRGLFYPLAEPSEPVSHFKPWAIFDEYMIMNKSLHSQIRRDPIRASFDDGRVNKCGKTQH